MAVYEDDKEVLIQDPFGNEVPVMLSSIDVWLAKDGYKKISSQKYTLNADDPPSEAKKSSKASS